MTSSNMIPFFRPFYIRNRKQGIASTNSFALLKNTSCQNQKFAGLKEKEKFILMKVTTKLPASFVRLKCILVQDEHILCQMKQWIANLVNSKVPNQLTCEFRTNPKSVRYKDTMSSKKLQQERTCMQMAMILKYMNN